MSRDYAFNRRVNRAEKGEAKFLRLGAGKILSGDKFQGGACLRRVPRDMSSETLFRRKFLALLAHIRDSTGAYFTLKELTALYVDRYGESVKRGTISPILSEFFTLGLVERKPVNKNTSIWAMKPGVDVRDTTALLALCNANLAKLRTENVKMSSSCVGAKKHRLPRLLPELR